jgi:hypothetical protein
MDLSLNVAAFLLPLSLDCATYYSNDLPFLPLRSYLFSRSALVCMCHSRYGRSETQTRPRASRSYIDPGHCRQIRTSSSSSSGSKFRTDNRAARMAGGSSSLAEDTGSISARIGSKRPFHPRERPRSIVCSCRGARRVVGR